jgi:hypothetical protein
MRKLLAGMAAVAGRLFDRQYTGPVKPTRPGSAAQIAYLGNLNATASCIHLQPVEHAMRVAGISVRLLEVSPHAPIVTAICRINEAALRRAFALPESIYYKEGYEPERTPHDHPRADLICLTCIESDRERCDILVLHPDECRPDTRWFPSPPAGT